uniref:Exostosin domain-containing protein n=1 Tax=Steinernema glaseri TaxID=37863 RepID=A0A1I7YEY2_9BILA
MSTKALVDSDGSFGAFCGALRRRNCLMSLGAVILTLFIFVTLLLFFSIESSTERRFAFHGLGEEDSFCHHPLWGDARQRVDELKRIRDSVRQELSEAADKLAEANLELEAVTREIPNKKLELQNIERQIEEARRVQKEIDDRHNVRVFLPSEPLWPLERNQSLQKSSIEGELLLDSAFDFGRCSITTGFRFYLYDSHSENALHKELSSHPNRVPEANKACILVALVEGADSPMNLEHWNVPEANKACLLVALVEGADSPTNLEHWNGEGQNHLLIDLGTSHADWQKAMVIGSSPLWHRSAFRDSAFLGVPEFDEVEDWKRYQPLLPHRRKNLLAYKGSSLLQTLEGLRKSAENSVDTVDFSPEANLNNSVFSLVHPAEDSQFHRLLYDSLLAGSVPVVLDSEVKLPFDDLLDWNLFSVRVSKWRLPELHYVLRSIPLADILEMRRMGRVFLEEYLGNARALSRTIISATRSRIGIPSDALSRTIISAVRSRIGIPSDGRPVDLGRPMFNESFLAPQIAQEKKPTFEEEELGPVEAPSDSQKFLHNFTSFSMYSYKLWNQYTHFVHHTQPYLLDTPVMPSESEFYPETNAGMRPIKPGSGEEFVKAVGGNRPKEQFTIVMLTYNRDAVLSASLERLRNLSYLNKVIVVWNNVDREAPRAWPRIHVPIEFVRAETNSLNNRFIPYEQIHTEAVLSMDDDIDLKQHEIILAFRVWRERRDQIVGFPARHHARFGDSMFYNSNHTCQYSMILTGAAFIHHSFLGAYTHHMPAAIRAKVDELKNCEDIAMNFLASHITRKPPVKTTSKWTLRCPTCTESLSNDESHFLERHDCIRFFTDVYGYNPLLFTQFRADSVLFKTRVPQNCQKCFKYV